MLLVALDMLLDMPDNRLLFSAALDDDLASEGFDTLVFLSFLLDMELPFFI